MAYPSTCSSGPGVKRRVPSQGPEGPPDLGWHSESPQPSNPQGVHYRGLSIRPSTGFSFQVDQFPGQTLYRRLWAATSVVLDETDGAMPAGIPTGSGGAAGNRHPAGRPYGRPSELGETAGRKGRRLTLLAACHTPALPELVL